VQATTDRPRDLPSQSRTALTFQVGLCALAAIVTIVRAARTDEPRGVVLASVAAAAALAAAVTSFRHRRWAAVPLLVAIVMEVTVLLGSVAPPRIVNAIPLLFAFGLAVTPTDRARPRNRNEHRSIRGAVSSLSVASMVVLGVAFVIGPNIIAPYPDIFVSYALYAVLVAVTVALARRQSAWIAALPPITLGIFVLMVQIGETFRDWGG
jgi:hypothetical protein